MDFVLVHGGFHVGAAWDGVRQVLEKEAHSVISPTLLGHGIDVETRVTHQDQVDGVIREIEAAAMSDIVLVAHSYGGTITSAVVTRIPERIQRLVYFDALVPVHGTCPIAEFESFHALFMSGQEAGEVDMPAFLWRELFMNDSDLETAESALGQLVPQPTQPILDTVDCPGFAELPLAKSYIIATEDLVFPAGTWMRMAERLGIFRFLQMHGGHEVMYSNPAGLAARILDASRP